MNINSRNQLQEWLDKNYGFEDGFISSIENLDNILTIKVGYQTKGTYVAGKKQELIEFAIRPKRISKWNYDTSKFQPSYDSCILGIELTNKELGLKFDTPYVFELVFDSIEIDAPQFIKTYTKPWISDKEIFFTASSNELPRPKYWIDCLRKFGHEVCFRYFGGDEIKCEKVPYPDYVGYFLQHKNLINDTDCGLFFSSLKQSGGEIGVSIENKDEKTRDIFNTIQKIATDWDLSKVNCGNVEFKKSEWNSFVLNGIFPKHIEELKRRNVW